MDVGLRLGAFQGRRTKMVNHPNRKRAKHGYRVVYGESRPAWEKIFPTMREAKAFAKEHEGFGDIIFSIKPVVPGEPPQSMMAAIEAQNAG